MVQMGKGRKMGMGRKVDWGCGAEAPEAQLLQLLWLERALQLSYNMGG